MYLLETKISSVLLSLWASLHYIFSIFLFTTSSWLTLVLNYIFSKLLYICSGVLVCKDRYFIKSFKVIYLRAMFLLQYLSALRQSFSSMSFIYYCLLFSYFFLQCFFYRYCASSLLIIHLQFVLTSIIIIIIIHFKMNLPGQSVCRFI